MGAGAAPSLRSMRGRRRALPTGCSSGGYYDTGDHVKFGLPRSSEAYASGLEMFAVGFLEAGLQAALGSDNHVRRSVEIAI